MHDLYSMSLTTRVGPGSDESATHETDEPRANGLSLVDDRPTVVVIDPRSLSREGLMRLLENSGMFRIAGVSQVAEFLQLHDETGFREPVVLLSLGSLEIGEQSRDDIATLSRSGTNASVIVLSDLEDSRQVAEAFNQGARGYIPTALSSRVVFEAVRFVQAGGTFVPSGAFAHALTQQRTERSDSAPDAGLKVPGLTPRQREVFDLLRRGKPNKIIAYELSMRESTVKVHVRTIMRKLKASNRAEVVFRASSLASAARLSVVPSA